MKNNFCLIAGISTYHHIRPLPISVLNDAKSIHDLIRGGHLGLYSPENVQCLGDADATGEAIRVALQNLAECCTTDSTVLIYFSGHGGQLLSGPHAGAFLLPVDTRYGSDDELAATAISSQEFSEALRKIPARRLVVLFDCCHSGGIGQPKDLNGAELKAGLPESYYQQLASGWGRVIISSSRETEPSWVRPGDDNSLFTRHLLDGLRGKALVAGNYVRILDLFSYIQPKVTGEQPNQHPVLKAEIETNFPIAFIEHAPAQPSIKTPDDEFEHDVFVSYRPEGEDRVWVRKKLIPALATAGLNVFSEDDFEFGRPVVLEAQRAVVESRYTLAVFSPDYLDSGFSDLENLMAQHLGSETRKSRFIGLIFRDCPLDLRFRYLKPMDMRDESEFDDNIKRLVKTCATSPG